jgi:hypothetical protein
MLGWLKRRAQNSINDAMKNDLERFIHMLKGASSEELGALLVIANTIRLNLEALGRLPNSALDISSYRGTVEDDMIPVVIGKFIKEFQSQGQPTDAAGAMVWFHSVRAIQNPEVRFLGREMWAELSRGFKYVEQKAEELRAAGVRVAIDIEQQAFFVPSGLEPLRD